MQGKKGKTVKPQDFVPGYNKPKKEQTVEEQIKYIERINKALGGTDKRH